MAAKQALEKEMQEFRQIAMDISKLTTSESQYMSQLNENEMVKKELDILGGGSTVFKLIGPVLVKQELSEAKSNVQKRIEFIKKELKRIEDTRNQLEKKQKDKREKIIALQSSAAK